MAAYDQVEDTSSSMTPGLTECSSCKRHRLHSCIQISQIFDQRTAPSISSRSRNIYMNSIGGRTRCKRIKQRASAVSIFLIVMAGLGVVLLVSMALALLNLYQSHAILMSRLETLEREVAECCSTYGVRRDQHKDIRNRKFGFFREELGSHPLDVRVDIGSNNIDLALSKIHPIQHIKSTIAAMETPQASPSRNSIIAEESRKVIARREAEPIDDTSPSSREERREGRRKERERERGSTRQRQREPRDRSSEDTLTGDPVDEIRGVHFEANLNRTTTIGVGEAGWLPHWSLSSSISHHQNLTAVHQSFRLHARGNVTVRVAGLYYVYSQMMYYDPHEYIGHSIVVNGVELFTCIAPVEQRQNKYKTCFIGGLVYVTSDTKIGIKMLYTPRQVCLFEDTSYFGMFRVI